VKWSGVELEGPMIRAEGRRERRCLSIGRSSDGGVCIAQRLNRSLSGHCIK